MIPFVKPDFLIEFSSLIIEESVTEELLFESLLFFSNFNLF